MFQSFFVDHFWSLGLPLKDGSGVCSEDDGVRGVACLEGGGCGLGPCWVG